MAPNPPGFLEHLRSHGYHPRSDKHSNSLSECIVSDLLEQCSSIRQQAAAGRLVYSLNFTLFTGTADWKVDLVFGDPPPGQPPPSSPTRIVRTPPSTVQIAIELKAVMTEHRKAVKNRKRDFEAHHDHVHRYSRRTIAAGLLVLNGASVFRSPLRDGPTVHRNPDDLVRHCVSEMRAVSQRSSVDGVGLDAKGVIVVDFDNQNLSAAKYASAGNVPRVGDPLHYDAFVQRICALFGERFLDH